MLVFVMTAPSESDLELDFSNVVDPNVRVVLQRFQQQHVEFVGNSNVFQQQVMQQLLALNAAFVQFGVRLNPDGVIPFSDPHRIAAFPSVVVCNAPSSASSSLKDQFSSSAVNSSSDCTSGSSSDGPLRCPFCNAGHSNEKSHCQHICRLAKR